MTAFLHKSAQIRVGEKTMREEERVSPTPPSQRGVSRPKTKTETKTERRHIYVSPKPLNLIDLPKQTEWWNALAERYPNVDLEHELLKAMDWHRADLVKSPKLFFRNWIERASHSAPRVERELTPDQVRERLRVVS